MTWLTTEEVLAHLRIGRAGLVVLMASSRASGLTGPWVVTSGVDGAVGARYRWVAADVDAWVVEVTRWRASQNAAADGGSVGAIRTARTAPSPSRVGKRPSASRSRSKTPSPSEEPGNLNDLWKRLASG